MTGEDSTGGPLDVATLTVIGRRSRDHPLVDSWSFHPDRLSPRRLELTLDDAQYPESVVQARLDCCWYEGGQYTFHYLEERAPGTWQCRWDRHPKPGGPRTHFHPPPDASVPVEPSGLDDSHHLDVLFDVLERIEVRLGDLHEPE